METSFSESPISLSCHSSKSLVAVGLVDGTISTIGYSKGDQRQLSKNDHQQPLQIVEHWSKRHKAPVRKVRFSFAGDHLMSLTRNRTLTQWDTETGRKIRVVRHVTDDEKSSARPYSMRILSEHRLAVGDESGKIHVFDWRCQNDPPRIATLTDDQTDEYITDICSDLDDPHRLLFATCGDCTLLTVDLRKRKLIMKSETMHSELLSVTTAKNETKLLCGGADGYMEAFNWDEWANIVERIDTKHKDTVDCLLTVDENLIVSGSADGTIRLHHVFPNRTLDIVGRHDNDAHVEELALSYDRRLLVSCGQDSKVKFWDLETLRRKAPKCQDGARLKKQVSKKRRVAFFDDLCAKDDE